MKEKCINCGEEHKASDKRCKIYKINEQMNKIKAEERVTSYEARIKIQKAQRKEDNKGDEKKRREKENTAIIKREREVTERSIRRGTEDEQERLKERWSDIVRGMNRRLVEEDQETTKKKWDKNGSKGNRNKERITRYDASSSEEDS